MPNAVLLKDAKKLFEDRMAIHRAALRVAQSSDRAFYEARAAVNAALNDYTAANAAVTSAAARSVTAGEAERIALAAARAADKAVSAAWKAATDALKLIVTHQGTPAMPTDLTYTLAAPFARFTAHTPAGESAWRSIESVSGGGSAWVRVEHLRSTLAQIRRAGYTVAKAKPAKAEAVTAADRDLLAELEA